MRDFLDCVHFESDELHNVCFHDDYFGDILVMALAYLGTLQDCTGFDSEKQQETMSFF